MSGTKDPDKNLDPDEADRLEKEHFEKVVRSFYFYRQHAMERVYRSRDSFLALPQRHQDLQPGFMARLEEFEKAIEKNYELALAIADHYLMFQEPPANGGTAKDLFATEWIVDKQHRSSDFDMEKVYTTLKQYVRDWADEGKSERDACYGPIVDAIDRLYHGEDPRDISVLVPGAGLGRLLFECATRGYHSQGNEWSVQMLLGSNYILNGRGGTFHTELHPFAHLYCNNYSLKDQLRSVQIPDVDPFDLPPSVDYSYAAGDFLEIYTTPCEWDCVASCFFLDTARNICAYLETIFMILRPGGYLINFGPLLYHFADNREAPSLELSYEELRALMLKIGFVFLEEKYPCPCGYINNDASMMQTIYKCVFFIAMKPPLSEGAVMPQHYSPVGGSQNDHDRRPESDDDIDHHENDVNHKSSSLNLMPSSSNSVEN